MGYILDHEKKNPEITEIARIKSHIKALGILHGYNIDENPIWMDKINKVGKKRDLTIQGRVLVIKILLLSKTDFEIEF